MNTPWMRRVVSTLVALVVLAIASQGIAAAQRGDELFAEVGRRVPQFAGLVADPENEALLVLVTERYEGITADVKAALLEVFPAGLLDGRPLDNMRLIDATYSFVQLKDWRDRLFTTVFSIEGVVSEAIDVGRNRIAVGVENLQVQGPQVEEEIERHNIPRESVIINAGNAFAPSSLRSRSDSRGWLLPGAGGVIVFASLGAWMIRARTRRARMAASDVDQAVPNEVVESDVEKV